MSERDPIVALLREPDYPVAPRAEFAEELRTRLLQELVATNGAQAPRRARRSPFAPLVRHRRPVLAGAIAIAAAAVAIVAFVVSRPAPASAIDVIHWARKAFAAAPPFEATMRVDLNPNGTNAHVPKPARVPKGATATVVIRYGGDSRFRIETEAVKPRFPTAISPGSFEVFDGRTIGTYDSKRNTFYSSPAPNGYAPLDYFSWRGSYPDWERICRGPGSKVFPDAQVAGRDARHIQCSDLRGHTWELWIDAETGLLLKVVGTAPGDDFFSDRVGASAKGGFEVERLRLNPAFAPRTFAVTAPPGAVDYQARRRAAKARLQAVEARVPPFQAVFRVRDHGGTYVNRASWQNSRNWRTELLAGAEPNLPGGAGSFVVSAGGRLKKYDARHDTYARSTVTASANPMKVLLPEADHRYSRARCPITGHDRIAGADAVRRHCPGYDIWVDSSTGLLLRQQAPGYALRVRRVEYRPAFAPATFRFAVPPGARSARRPRSDPYFKTALAPGRVAPNWSARRLEGGAFSLADLRGKPALLLLTPDWCLTDRACYVFRPLERAYENVGGKVAIAWVDFQGRAKGARKVVRHNHLTFPVVVDAGNPGAVMKAWKLQGYPYWLLLDSRGRVIEARFNSPPPKPPMTTAQLEQLLAKAER